MNQGQHGNYGKVRRVQWLVNTVTVAEGVSVPCFVAGTVLGLCWYMVRRLELGGVWMWFCVGVVAILLIAWGLWYMCGRWFSRRDTEALLDEQLGLNAALCAREQWGAAAGVTAHPLPDGQVIKLRSAPWAAWMIGGVVLAICGGLLPLPEKNMVKVIPDLPPSLVQVEKALDMMEESGQIEEKSLEPFREQLQDLKKKSHNEMFSHAGLETADALKGKAAAAVAGLSNEMFKADAALSMFENVNGASDMEGGTQALKDALKGMQSQEIQPGGMVGRQLQELAQNADLSNLTPEQIQQMRQQLAQAAQQLRDMAAQCGMGQIVMPNDGDQPGECSGGEEGEAPGQGGVSKGKGDAPIAFRPEAYEKLEALPNRVENNDMRRAALGDVTGVEASAPSPEHEVSGPEHGGSGAHPSKGGDAVWTEELTPREQEALKGIFK